MRAFLIDNFHEMSGLLVKLHSNPQFLQSEEGKNGIKELLPQLFELCKELELTLSANKLNEIYHSIGGGNQTTVANLIRMLKELDERIYEEIGGRFLFHISVQDIPYIQPMGALYSEKLEANFTSALEDVEHSGTCYAFGEFTACVFHSMRALEKALLALAKEMGMSAKELSLENWKNIIDMVEKRIREMEQLPKSIEKSDSLKKYAGLAVQFRYFKDAWRNHVSHSRAKYDASEARQIMIHTFDFLCEAASSGLSDRLT